MASWQSLPAVIKDRIFAFVMPVIDDKAFNEYMSLLRMDYDRGGTLFDTSSWAHIGRLGHPQQPTQHATFKSLLLTSHRFSLDVKATATTYLNRLVQYQISIAQNTEKAEKLYEGLIYRSENCYSDPEVKYFWNEFLFFNRRRGVGASRVTHVQTCLKRIERSTLRSPCWRNTPRELVHIIVLDALRLCGSGDPAADPALQRIEKNPDLDFGIKCYPHAARACYYKSLAQTSLNLVLVTKAVASPAMEMLQEWAVRLSIFEEVLEQSINKAKKVLRQDYPRLVIPPTREIELDEHWLDCLGGLRERLETINDRLWEWKMDALFQTNHKLRQMVRRPIRRSMSKR